VIDPVTAFAAVQSAVALIKKAKSTVDDVRSLGPLVGKFFEAKHETAKAVAQAKKSGGSSMAQAVQIEMELMQQEQFEADLKDLFIYSGNSDVWAKIEARVAEAHRAEIEEARAEKAREARRKKEAKQIADVLTAIFIIGAIMFVILSFVWQVVRD
jgi:hypothetical protein